MVQLEGNVKRGVFNTDSRGAFNEINRPHL